MPHGRAPLRFAIDALDLIGCDATDATGDVGANRDVTVQISASELTELNRNILYATLGVEVESACDGDVVSRLTPTEGVCWPVPGRPHGGILFTFLDTTMATAVMCNAEHPQVCSTVSLEIQYPQSAVADYYLCEARCTHQTRRLTFVRGEIRSACGALMALGQGTFRMTAGALLTGGD